MKLNNLNKKFDLVFLSLLPVRAVTRVSFGTSAKISFGKRLRLQLFRPRLNKCHCGTVHGQAPRTAASTRPGYLPIITPEISDPFEGYNNPIISLINVVLPAPFSPRIPTISPLLISKLIVL